MRDVDEPGNISPMKAPTLAEVKAKQGYISPMKAPTLAEVKGFLCSEYTDLEAEKISTLKIPTLTEVKNFLGSDDKYLDVEAEVVWQNYVEQAAEVMAQLGSSTSTMPGQAMTRSKVEQSASTSALKVPTLTEVKNFLGSDEKYLDVEAEEVWQNYVEQVAEIRAQH